MKIVELTSADDPLLAPYLGVRDRDLARTDGMFIAEGEVVVRMLASPRQTQYRLHSLFLERRRLASLSEVLAPLDVPAYVVTQEVMDSVVGFNIHRGVLALAERGTPRAIGDLLAGSSGLAVGLVGLTNHDNVGSVFRNAAAFGAHAVLLDHATCDPLYRKAIRVSVGAALVVPFARASSAHALLDAIEAAGWEALALSARGTQRLEEVVCAPKGKGQVLPMGKGQVLLMGTEGDGLAPDVLARARPVRIDMTGVMDSLNVAVASGIALYEATKQRLR